MGAIFSYINITMIQLGFALLLGVLALICVFVSRRTLQVKETRKENNTIPRGSMGWPLFGETLDYLKPHQSNSIGQFLKQRCSRYGRVFKSHLFGCPTIVSCDMELNAFILQNEGKLFTSSYPKSMQDILGNLSLLLVSGEQHRKVRNTAVSHIGTIKSRLDFLHYVDNLSISVMESWKNSKQKILFLQGAKQFTLHVMLKSLIDMEPGDPLAPIFLQDFLTFMKGFISLPLYLPGTPYAKAMQARRRISSTLGVIIEERKKRRKVGNSHSWRGDFLDEILQKDQLNDEERVSIVIDLLLAGYETTSGLISLVVYFLWLAPKALHQLREEHRQIRRKKEHGELLNFEDYKQMEFTIKVINESLRCGNLVKFLHRKSLKDVKFKEYVIPAGWKVLPILSAAHLDPFLHEHPSLFNPWRWEDEATSRKVAAFGGGARLCPGAELAKLETAFFLHRFVLNFSWKIEDDECPISYPYLDFRRGLVMEIEALREEEEDVFLGS